ncbi:uncharacterized protein [Diabrotica undecimpunctata]|uniref:uncharacterized protein n=1 Tax=Diabrotica undecimpunctata TaxID=50387 RepID=UPI003B63A805
MANQEKQTNSLKCVVNMVILCILSVFFLCTTDALPSKRGLWRHVEPSQSGYMIGGYYKNPSPNQDYYPSMTAFVTKDVVATNTFAGLPQEQGWNSDSKEEFTERVPVAQDIPNRTPEIAIENSDSAEGSTANNNNINKTNRKGRKPSRPQQEDEDETPWWASKSGGPSFTSFFPINISGGGGGSWKRRSAGSGAQDENDIPYSPSGSATAIANSFSTGRGGVATSHATSFGDPYLAAMFLRNGYNLKGHGQQRAGATNY